MAAPGYVPVSSAHSGLNSVLLYTGEAASESKAIAMRRKALLAVGRPACRAAYARLTPPA